MLAPRKKTESNLSREEIRSAFRCYHKDKLQQNSLFLTPEEKKSAVAARVPEPPLGVRQDPLSSVQLCLPLLRQDPLSSVQLCLPLLSHRHLSCRVPPTSNPTKRRKQKRRSILRNVNCNMKWHCRAMWPRKSTRLISPHLASSPRRADPQSLNSIA